jgi:hypothetical protein
MVSPTISLEARSSKLELGEAKTYLFFPITANIGQTSMSHNLYVPVKWDTSDLTSTESTSALYAITSWEFIPEQTYNHCGTILLRPRAGYYE